MVERVREACGKNGKVGPPVHDDLVERDCTAGGPNMLWLSEITERRTSEGKLYLCAIKNEFSNLIAGYSIDSRMKSRLATTAFSGGSPSAAMWPVRSTQRPRQFRSRKSSTPGINCASPSATGIERTYNSRRCQTALGRLTPVEFEAIMTTPAD